MMTDREAQTLRRLQGELRLVRAGALQERARIAALAETWGHTTFAKFLRAQPDSQPDSSCDTCLGLGCDSNGQPCADCQGLEGNPSFG